MQYINKKQNIDKLELYFSILNSALSKNNLVRLSPIVDDNKNIIFIETTMKTIENLIDFINKNDILEMYQRFIQMNSNLNINMYSLDKKKVIMQLIREKMIKTHNIVK